MKITSSALSEHSTLNIGPSVGRHGGACVFAPGEGSAPVEGSEFACKCHCSSSLATPMTPAAGVQHPGQSASSMSFMQQVKGSAYSVFSSQGDPEPSLFQYDDELLGVDPIPGDPTTDKDSEDSYDISNGIMTRYNTYRQHKTKYY